MAPAIANAVFALTGIQSRELPVLPEKILNEKSAPRRSEEKVNSPDAKILCNR
jgi:hypothetical protein